MSASPSNEHLAQLAAARIASVKVRRAIAVANFDGWSTLSLGAIGLLFSMIGGISYPGVLLGVAMVGLGWRQLAAARALRELSPLAPAKLANNQWLLCAAVCLYAGWELYQAMTTPGQIEQELASAGGMQQFGGYANLEKTITVGLYAAVIVGSILIMGGTAWYYRGREKILQAYLAQTPEWILAMQRRGELI